MGRKLRIAGIEMDADEIAQEMATNPAVITEVTSLANKAADYWRSIAPVGDPAVDPHSGDYKASIGVTVLRGRNGVPFARVEATDPKAHWIEYGTEHMPEFACMQKTKAQFSL